MFMISFPAGSSLVFLGWVLFRFFSIRRTGHFSWQQEARHLLFLINILVIYRFTFHPFSKVNGAVQPLIFEAASAWPFRINLIPFVNLLNYESMRDLLLNLIGNFAMFIPTGIVVPLIYKNQSTCRKVVCFGFLMSLTIEVFQLPFAVRCSDVDDLILNTAGVLAGYGIYALVRFCTKRRA